MSVEVWLIETAASAVELTAYEQVLDDSERERAAGARSEAARRQYVIAHGARRMVLGERLGVEPAALAFTVGPHGKPAIDGMAIQISLSHSGGWAMLALSLDRPVGVDVQLVLPSLDANAMARRWFAPREAADLATADPAIRADVFARLWARKEAVVKAAGGRILRSSAIDVGWPVVDFSDESAPGPYRIQDLSAPAGYRAAVALAGAAAVDVISRRWRPAGA